MSKNKKYVFLITTITILFLLVLSYINGLLQSQVGDRDFAIQRDKNITQIQIIPPEKNQTIKLKKDEDQLWRIDNNYNANDAAVRDLIRTVNNFSVRYPVPVNDRDMINDKLENGGTTIKIFTDDYLFNFFGLIELFKISRETRAFILGENIIDDNDEIIGTYARMVNSVKPYVIYRPGFGGVKNVFTTKKHVWFDPVIIDLEPEEIREIKIVSNESPEQSFILKIDKANLFGFYDLKNKLISDNFSIDTSKVQMFLFSFNELFYESLLKDDAYLKSEKLIFDDYAYKVVVYDRKGNRYCFYSYRKQLEDGDNKNDLDYDPDRFYIELENGHRALAKYFVFGRVFRNLSFFKLKK